MDSDLLVRRALERTLDQWDDGQLNRLQVVGQLANYSYFLMEIEMKARDQERKRQLDVEG